MTLRRAALALAAALLLAGCGASGDDETSADPVVIDITIADGEVTPAHERVDVRVGQRVVAQVTSDVEDELHVHGEPEATWAVEPGMDGAEFDYTPTVPGQIAVESHVSDVTIVTLVVTPR